VTTKNKSNAITAPSYNYVGLYYTPACAYSTTVDSYPTKYYVNHTYTEHTKNKMTNTVEYEGNINSECKVVPN
jgi:lipoprotein NlpI